MPSGRDSCAVTAEAEQPGRPCHRFLPDGAGRGARTRSAHCGAVSSKKGSSPGSRMMGSSSQVHVSPAAIRASSLAVTMLLDLPLRGLLVQPAIHLRLVSAEPPGTGDHVALAAESRHVLPAVLQERGESPLPAHQESRSGGLPLGLADDPGVGLVEQLGQEQKVVGTVAVGLLPFLALPV